MEGWKKYTTADEFASDELFRKWVASGFYGREGHPFSDFLAAHAELISLANEAADLLRVTGLPDHALTSDQLKAQIDETWRRIRLQERDKASSVKSTRRIWLRWASAAAFLLIGGLVWRESQKTIVRETVSAQSALKPASWKAFTNQGPGISSLSLSDGSMVWLEPGSELRFPNKFDSDKREVTLIGEAFFEISKNKQQPFFVKTHDLITEVVGTSFSIRTLGNNKGTMVQVRTGQVLVHRVRPDKAKEAPVELRANQQLRFSENSEELLTEQITRPSIISERLDKENFEFMNTPVATVLEALSKAYGLPVEYDKASFQNCEITTALSDEPLIEKLKILAETIGKDTQIELINGKILLEGPGCP